MMDIRILTATAFADADLAAHARGRLQLRLQHHGDRVDRVDVKLGGTPSRRHRHDSFCVVRLQLRGIPPATVVDVGGDAYGAVDRAADRVGRLAAEQLRRDGASQAGSPQGTAA